MIKKYEIWDSRGVCHGWYDADSFLEACEKLAKLNPEWGNLFNRKQMTY